MENLEPALVGSIQKAQFIHTFVGAPLIGTVIIVPFSISVNIMQIIRTTQHVWFNDMYNSHSRHSFSQVTKLLSDIGTKSKKNAGLFRISSAD
jgi:hypothetical protein